MATVLVLGIAAGCVYALVAVGYSLIYRTTGIVNFAQGTFVMIGGMVGWWLLRVVHLPYAFAVLLAVVVAAMAGLVLWGALILPLWRRRARPFVVILATLVAGTLASNLVLLGLGSQPQTLPEWIPGAAIAIAGARVSAQYLLVIGATLAALAGVGAALRWTTLGRSLRACAASRDTSRLLGISPERVGAVAMVTTAALGGLAGVLIAPAQYTSYDAALTYGVFGFVAAVVGGFGSLSGALVGGLLVGLIQSLVGRYISVTYETVVAFAVLLALLAIRPQGIAGAAWEAEE